MKNKNHIIFREISSCRPLMNHLPSEKNRAQTHVGPSSHVLQTQRLAFSLFHLKTEHFFTRNPNIVAYCNSQL